MHANSPHNQPSVQLTSSIETIFLIINTDFVPPLWSLTGHESFIATIHLQNQFHPNENGLWNFNEHDSTVILIKTLKQH